MPLKTTYSISVKTLLSLHGHEQPFSFTQNLNCKSTKFCFRLHRYNLSWQIANAKIAFLNWHDHLLQSLLRFFNYITNFEAAKDWHRDNKLLSLQLTLAYHRKQLDTNPRLPVSLVRRTNHYPIRYPTSPCITSQAY